MSQLEKGEELNGVRRKGQHKAKRQEGPRLRSTTLRRRGQHQAKSQERSRPRSTIPAEERTTPSQKTEETTTEKHHHAEKRTIPSQRPNESPPKEPKRRRWKRKRCYLLELHEHRNLSSSLFPKIANQFGTASGVLICSACSFFYWTSFRPLFHYRKTGITFSSRIPRPNRGP